MQTAWSIYVRSYLNIINFNYQAFILHRIIHITINMYTITMNASGLYITTAGRSIMTLYDLR